jgi:hypothetical protein
MTSLIEENRMMQDKYKSMLEKMQQEIRRKQLQVEELKNKVRFNLILNSISFILNCKI